MNLWRILRSCQIQYRARGERNGTAVRRVWEMKIRSWEIQMRNIAAEGNVVPCLGRKLLVARNADATPARLRRTVRANLISRPFVDPGRSGARRLSALMKKRTFLWMISWCPRILYVKDESWAKNGNLVEHGTRLDPTVTGCGKLWLGGNDRSIPW